MAIQEVVSGYPAKKEAILLGISPAPFYKLFPVTISYTKDLSNFTDSATAAKTVDNNLSHVVSFNKPLPDLVKAVLLAATITTSLGVFYNKSGLN